MTRFYDAGNYLLIHSDFGDPAEHSHMAAHIIISLDGKMRATSGSKEYICQGITIPSGTIHKVDNLGRKSLVFLYDITSDVAKQINSSWVISDTDCEKIIQAYYRFMKDPNLDSYKEFETIAMHILGLTRKISQVYDDRILSAIQYVHSRSSESLTCQQVADAVHLSQGRFSHLFKEQIGMTFAAYRIYQRLMQVYVDIFKGMNITEAAYRAGFSSSSHFADVNRRVFGISASSIIFDYSFMKIR